MSPYAPASSSSRRTPPLGGGGGGGNWRCIGGAAIAVKNHMTSGFCYRKQTLLLQKLSRVQLSTAPTDVGGGDMPASTCKNIQHTWPSYAVLASCLDNAFRRLGIRDAPKAGLRLSTAANLVFHMLQHQKARCSVNFVKTACGLACLRRLVKQY